MAKTDSETPVMFPELDDSPAHKALLKAAKAYARAKADRDSTLTTAKEKVDGCATKLVGLMHEAKVMKFRHAGIRAEVIEPKEKVVVTLEDEDEEEPADED